MIVYQASARASDLSDFPQAYIDAVERGYFLRPGRHVCCERMEGVALNASCTCSARRCSLFDVIEMLLLWQQLVLQVVLGQGEF